MNPVVPSLFGLCLAAAVAAQAGQPGYQNPPDPALPWQPPQVQGGDPTAPSPFDPQGRLRQAPRVTLPSFQPEPEEPRDRLDPVWSQPLRPTQFQGFPTFPMRLFGAYPTAGDPAAGAPPLQLPAALPPTAWPTWLMRRAREPLPDSPELCLLVRVSDRVWVRSAAAEPFVPLYHWDAFETLSAGHEAEIRQTGQFALLLHRSGRLMAYGPTGLRVSASTPAVCELDLHRLTRVRLECWQREHRLRLPDGSMLVVAGDPAEAVTPGRAVITLQRIDDGEGRPGRVELLVTGDRAVRWQQPWGETVVEPGHRAAFLLAPRTGPAAAVAGVATDGLEASVHETQLRASGRQGASLSWSGALFRPAAGEALRIDPLQGDPFAGLPGAPR